MEPGKGGNLGQLDTLLQRDEDQDSAIPLSNVEFTGFVDVNKAGGLQRQALSWIGARRRGEERNC